MRKDFYSNEEFSELREKLNREILRRGTYSWWRPLSASTVGEDIIQPGVLLDPDDSSYTINDPSSGSVEPTRNIKYPHGNNPSIDNTSAARFDVDEIRNYLVGLATIQDINLFYGRDEVYNTAFRDPNGIEEAVIAAQKSMLNVPLHESDISPTKNDPNGDIKNHKNPDYPVEHEVTYPMEDGKYIMPSGEYDGEELLIHSGLNEQNFYDDYGAQPGDSNFHPFNRYISPLTERNWNDQGHNRDESPRKVRQGGISSVRFGTNPRNPQLGNPYINRPVYGGKKGSCNIACTGLCYVTCDNECSESCTTSCWNRCGNSCTATCGNNCTSCSSQCHASCKTKCENSIGYSCVKAGAKSIKITTEGGHNGEPIKNTITITTHTCDGCSYSCQFYPNKKTQCWDAGCIGKCFTSCTNSCSTSCFGGCVNNDPDSSENDSFKTGKGRGCSSGCTLNCIGICSGICEGYCVQTCFKSCKTSCNDNCTYECRTDCGDGCSQGCTNGCTGCSHECSGECKNNAESRTCVGCGSLGGCTSNCQFDCNKNCIGIGCRNICGIGSAGSCEANCRLNCAGTSCTAMCSDACSNQCNTCVNTCGWNCGACTSECSVGCGAACNITCSEECSNNCNDNCVHSCSEDCGSCSNLCYSCIGICIGICSVKCENGCSSCTNTCGWWCDSSCNRECFANCSIYCINTCSGSCASYLMSETTNTVGPERDPIADGYIYPHPKNRWEERESFKLVRDIMPSKYKPKGHNLITINIIDNKSIIVIEDELNKPSKLVQMVYDNKNHIITTNIGTIVLHNDINIWRYHKGTWRKVKENRIYINEYIYIWDKKSFGEFNNDNIPDYLKRDSNLVITGPKEITWTIKQTSVHGGIYTVNPETGEITINEDMIPGIVDNNEPDLNIKDAVYVIILHPNDININSDDIDIKLPFEFDFIKSIRDNEGNIIVVIKKREFLLPSEMEESDGENIKS